MTDRARDLKSFSAGEKNYTILAKYLYAFFIFYYQRKLHGWQWARKILNRFLGKYIRKRKKENKNTFH